MTGGASTRRQFAQRAAYLSAAVAAATVGLPGLAQAAGGMQPEPGYSRARAATMTALLAAVGRVPGNFLAADPHAADSFRAWYLDAPSATQADVDRLLDALEALPGSRRFSEYDPQQRVELMRDWQRRGKDGNDAQARARLVEAMLVLAAVPLAAEDARSVVAL